MATRDVLPEEQIVDAGYTTAETLVDSQQEAGIDLVGPVNTDLSRLVDDQQWRCVFNL